MSFAPDLVYLVESDRDPTVMLGLDPRIGENGVEWFDTVRERGFPALAVRDEGDDMVVETAEATYRFTPLTVELYRAKVMAHVVGARAFASTAELQGFYRAYPR